MDSLATLMKRWDILSEIWGCARRITDNLVMPAQITKNAFELQKESKVRSGQNTKVLVATFIRSDIPAADLNCVLVETGDRFVHFSGCMLCSLVSYRLGLLRCSVT